MIAAIARRPQFGRKHCSGRDGKRDRRTVKQVAGQLRYKAVSAIPDDATERMLDRRVRALKKVWNIDFLEDREIIRILSDSRSNQGAWLTLEGNNYHHAPPRNPDNSPVFVGAQKTVNQVLAFRVLFRGATTLSGCVKILKDEWWTSTPGFFATMVAHAAYHIIFHAAKSFEHCVRILENDWGQVLA